jgi:phosphatidylglycerol:prolipoprotein diacylglycerol transferase
MPVAGTADALAAPIALGLAFEQLGALLAGSEFGTETRVPWAVTYTHPLAARWSGAPIGVPVHPVQAYAALGWLAISVLLIVVLPARRQNGDAAGAAMVAASVLVFITEIWRDWEGRGTLLHGTLDGPQAAAVLFLLAGALMLRERKGACIDASHAGGVAHE